MTAANYRLLTKKNELWHQEKTEIYLAGLGSSSWQYSDNSGIRVNGENQYCHVIGNPQTDVPIVSNLLTDRTH